MPDTIHPDTPIGTLVTVTGEVVRLLPDDQDGSRHQRFILRLQSGRTVLIAHNIDLSEPVPVEVGDRVVVRGDFEWNNSGGTIHWTHLDPRRTREGGWIKHDGKRYQ
ncbi:MAG: DUF3465 domain-containing protein [Phycisphaerales bacterium]|nr:DUF3465 domain-containing protein [Planctomycetota bacterium]MCH8507264.1 DUF3465 domain-containing protein [Phycisphaerales bacterium]